MKKIICFLFSFFILYSANGQRNYKTILETDKTVMSYFTKKDVNMLNKILIFFDSITINNNRKEKNIYKCYYNYLNQINKNYSTRDWNLNISKEDQKKLFDSFDGISFNKVWKYQIGYFNDNKDTLRFILLTNNSPYIKFLSKLSEKYPIIKDYYQSFIYAGDINASLLALTVHRYKEFNMKDIKIRLILAIHYLTINGIDI